MGRAGAAGGNVPSRPCRYFDADGSGTSAYDINATGDILGERRTGTNASAGTTDTSR